MSAAHVANMFIDKAKKHTKSYASVPEEKLVIQNYISHEAFNGIYITLVVWRCLLESYSLVFEVTIIDASE